MPFILSGSNLNYNCILLALGKCLHFVPSYIIIFGYVFYMDKEKYKRHMKKLKGSILLLLAAVIWGITFVAQSDAMKHIGPFTFNFIRFIIGAIVLLPLIPEFYRNKRKSAPSNISGNKSKKSIILGCVLCGTALFIATNLQQFGFLLGGSVGKAGFITSIYIILVPILGILFKKRLSLRILTSAIIALIGMYFLCMNGGFAFAPSDILYLTCALFFAVHIILISIYAPYISGTALSAIQFTVAAILSCICMLLFEQPNIHAIISAYIPLLYAGIFACGVAYTLQIIGQKQLEPSTASIIMSLESVVSVFAGMLILKQMLTTRETVGCIIMLFATVLAQLPEKNSKPGSSLQKLKKTVAKCFNTRV